MTLTQRREVLHVSVTGDAWYLELDRFWPDAFVAALRAGAPAPAHLHVVACELGALSTSYAGDDPRDLEGGDSAIDSVRRTDGVFLTLRRRARPWHGRRLSGALAAAGRDPLSVPLVVVYSKNAPHPPDYERLLLEQLGTWPLCAVVDVDENTGEGIQTACDRLWELIGRARAVPRPSASRRALPASRPTIRLAPPSFETSSIEEALDRRNDDQALDLVLAAWRGCRAPELARAAETLCYRARSRRPEELTHGAWMETCRARRAVDLAHLLDTLVLPFETEPLHRLARLVERAEALLDWPSDPRLTPRLSAMLVDVGARRRTPVWKALLALLVRHGDPRASVGLRRLVDDLDHHLRPPNDVRDPAIREAALDAIAALEDTFPEGLPTALESPPDRAWWGRLLDRISAMTDDPRAELLELSTATARRPLSSAELSRERQLVKTYAWEWLGLLVEVADPETAVFEGALAVDIDVHVDNLRALRETASSPRWSTITAIGWGGPDRAWGCDEAPEVLLRSPFATALRRLRGLSLRGLVDLALRGLGDRIEEIQLGFSESDPAVEAALAGAAALPALRKLSVAARAPSQVSWVWRTPVAPRLETLEVRTGSAWQIGDDVREWWRGADRVGVPSSQLVLRCGRELAVAFEREGKGGRLTSVSAWGAGEEPQRLVAGDLVVRINIDDRLIPLPALQPTGDAALTSWESAPDLVMEPIVAAPPGAGQIGCVVVDPGGRWAAFGDDLGRIEIHDAARFELVHTLVELAPTQVRAMAFDAAGERLLALAIDDTIASWSLPNFAFQRITRLDPTPPGGGNFRKAFSSDGRRCAVLGEEASSLVMSVHGPDGKRERLSPRLPGSGGGTSPLFSPDGRWLAMGTGERSGKSALILWDLDESAPSIVAARGDVKALGFSSDGEHLAWIDDRGCSTLSLGEPGLRRTAVSSDALLFDPAVYGLPEGSKLADVDAATTRRVEARSRSTQRSEVISDVVILPNGTAALGSEFRWARWRLLL